MKNIGIVLKVFWGISYSFDSFQTYLNVQHQLKFHYHNEKLNNGYV
jgi:hypothetical protein